MKAIAVDRAGNGGAKLLDVPRPRTDGIPESRGVLVRVLHVGVDGTDKEIIAGEYTAPPPGESYLITGHESFGVVEDVGSAIIDLAPGDFIVATVRRPASSLSDTIGTSDMTTDDHFYERVINVICEVSAL